MIACSCLASYVFEVVSQPKEKVTAFPVNPFSKHRVKPAPLPSVQLYRQPRPPVVPSLQVYCDLPLGVQNHPNISQSTETMISGTQIVKTCRTLLWLICHDGVTTIA